MSLSRKTKVNLKCSSTVRVVRSGGHLHISLLSVSPAWWTGTSVRQLCALKPRGTIALMFKIVKKANKNVVWMNTRVLINWIWRSSLTRLEVGSGLLKCVFEWCSEVKVRLWFHRVLDQLNGSGRDDDDVSVCSGCGLRSYELLVAFSLLGELEEDEEEEEGEKFIPDRPGGSVAVFCPLKLFLQTGHVSCWERETRV